MDALEQLVKDATITAAVLGRGEEYMLVPLDQDGAPLSESLLDEARAKRFEFCGVFGLVHGIARCKAQTPEDLPIMLLAMNAFVELVRERLTPKGDSVDWLERLMRLPDTRSEFGPS